MAYCEHMNSAAEYVRQTAESRRQAEPDCADRKEAEIRFAEHGRGYWTTPTRIAGSNGLRGWGAPADCNRSTRAP
jgi:hypothetical protein